MTASTALTNLRSWEAQYEKDFAAQTSSGPITFTEEQRRKNKEVLNRVSDLLPFEDAYKASDCDLIYRFLIGRHWSVANAGKGLREYIALRKKESLDVLIAEQLHPIIMSVLSPCFSNGVPCPLYGIDKEGLPILWLSPDVAKLIAAMKQFTETELLRGQMRAMELGRFVCRARGVDRCTYVIDLAGITMSAVNKATLGFMKGVMNILQVAYPEIMRRLLIFNTGWAVSAAWKVLRPFVDVRVQDKIKFESGAPTLAALQPYMTPEQVHPAFGGTGKSNIFDPIVDAEVERIRRVAYSNNTNSEASPPQSPSRTPNRESSFVRADNHSLFGMDPQTLHSFCPSNPRTACPTPTEDGRPSWPRCLHGDGPNDGMWSGEGDRVVIGAPRAVSAWMANMGAEGERTDALDSSQSASSGSDACAGKGAGAEERGLAGAARETSATTRSNPAPPSPSLASPRSCQDTQLGGNRRSSSGRETQAPLPEDTPEATSSPSADLYEEQPLSCITMSLTFGADGSITGYCGPQCVGHYQSGKLYAMPFDNDDESSSSPASSPVKRTPVFSPRSAARRQNTTVSASKRAVTKPKQSRHNPPVGELLFEAGHPIHNFLIVCDGQRNVRYILCRSRLRTRLSVYNVVGAATVHTEKNNRHFVDGQRVKMAVAVPNEEPGADGKGDWMLVGEDVTERALHPLQKLFSSKTKRNSVSTTDLGANGGAGAVTSASTEKEKEKESSWPASMLSSLRQMKDSAAGTASSVDRRGQSSARRGTSKETAATSSESVTPRGIDNSTPDGSSPNQLLADNKGQVVRFFNLLTKNPLPDLFALAVAITLSWSKELDGSKDKLGF